MLSRALRAWTGGTRPPDGYWEPIFRALALEIYSHEWLVFTEAWGDPPSPDTCKILWDRARYDAWSSLGRN